MTKLKKYSVGVYHCNYGSITVEATSKEKAEKIADKKLAEDGDSVIEKINERDYGTAFSEEIK